MMEKNEPYERKLKPRHEEGEDLAQKRPGRECLNALPFKQKHSLPLK